MLTNRFATQDDTIDIAAIVIGAERYVVLYDHRSRAEALRTFGRWASHPELTCTWIHADLMAKGVRENRELG
jgi:hypothetical protein